MRRLPFIFFLLCAFRVFGTNALLSLTDARLQASPYYSNRTVVLQPMSTPTVSSPMVVLSAQIIATNDVNGNLWYSNIFTGLYQVTVLAPPDREQFLFLVTATNLGNINVADNLVALGTATFPAGSVAWAAAVTDGRYARNTNQPVSFYMVTNALGYVPQPSTPNLTNWSILSSNAINTSTAYINATNGLGTNTALTGITMANQINATGLVSSAYAVVAGNFVGPEATPLVVLGYSTNFPIVQVTPVHGGATFYIDDAGKLIGNGAGLTNIPVQAGYQFGSINLTNWSALSTNILGVLGALYTNNDLATGAALTNGAILNLSNYVLTVSQNAANDDLLLGASATNNDNRLSLNATNQSLLIGANATNESLLIGANATNESLLIGANATNDDLFFGNSATNNDNRLSVNATNEALLIGANGTNNVLAFSNNAIVQFQKGSAVLTNISGAGGTPSSSTFLRGDYSWQTPAGGGTVTSVALTAPTAEFSVSGSPVTTSGTLAISKNNQNANSVWAGPTTGGSGAPTFRALVPADIPSSIFNGWLLTGNSGTLPPTQFLGTTDNQPIYFKVNGNQVMILNAGGQVLIGSSASGIANPYDSILAGVNNVINTVLPIFSYNIIVGGNGNQINGATSAGTILGGSGNSLGASTGAAVIGGSSDEASGNYAFVAGGANNRADAVNSFAAGQKAQAVNNGAFVWADTQSATYSSTNNDSFNVRARGGVILSQTPLFALTNYASFSTVTNPVTSGVNWTNTTLSRVSLAIDYTLYSTNGFPGFCFTNLSNGEWFNATNSTTNSVISGRINFLLSPAEILIATNKSSSSGNVSLDASWARTQ